MTAPAMSNLIVPLIMCGGAGTRLWPASREGRPKQFLRLFGRYSTFQETVHRVSDRSLFGAPIVVTNGQYCFLAAEQLAEIQSSASGVGVRGMRERVHQLGGQIHIQSNTSGTTVYITLPVSVKAPHSAVRSPTPEAAD